MTSPLVKGALATCVALLAACSEAPVATAPTADAARDVRTDYDATPDGSTDALPSDGSVTDGSVTDASLDASLDASTPDASDDGAPPLPRDASLRIAAPTTPDASTGDASSAAPAIGTDGLVAWYPLDGDFRDAQGAHALTADGAPAFTDEAYPRVGRAYGPTGRSAANGATDTAFTSVDLARGVTLEGWVRGRDNNAVGLLFGWGQVGDGAPTLGLLDSYGFVAVRIGRDYRNVFVGNFDRVLGDACWHHLALVLPPGALEGAAFQLYIDGVAATLDTQNRASPGVPMGTLAVRNTVDNVLGSPFHVGAFGGPQGGTRQVDEVRVWSRALTPDEVRREAAPVALSRRCLPPLPPAWAPGPLCAPHDATVQVDLGVRVLTDDTIAIVTDPNPWMTRLLRADCGRFLDAVDAQGGSLLGWEVARYYDEAALNTQARVRPVLLDALLAPGWFALARDGAATSATLVATWPQPTREWVLPTSVTGREPVRTTAAEVVYYSYLHLAERLVPGGRYVVDDGTGARVAFTYDLAHTVSWALQVDQLGYAVDAPKYAYLGAWMGPAGALDLRRFEGAPFRVARERDGVAVFTGVIRHRAEPTTWGADRQPVTGAQVFEMNFTALTTPGRYRVEVPGAGRSWAFTVGDDALGEAFYTHARALYHARCGTEIAAAVTPWHRGDAHGVTRRGAAPGEPDDYTDHAAAGWGFRTASGAWAAHDEFEMVSRTATDTVLAGVSGGWHDAADFDRASWHLTAHDDLAHAYLFYPTHFTDGQLGIPESGNGVPDVLDEAVWGIDIFRRGQEADGRTSIHVEATSHPRVSDAAVDSQPYYLGLATRKSSLAYAARAALMARALARAGDATRAALYLASAQRAWAFGTGPTRVTLAVPGTTETWSEPATPPPERVLSAAVQLWLATGDAVVRAVLDRADIDAAFRREAAAPLLSPYELLDVALAPDRFPAAWGALARASVIAGADLFVDAQATEPYRKLWYPPTHGYFWTLGWGQGHFQTARFAIGAYLLTGDARYRDAAYLAVNWEQGANPQGRVQTTGLGANGVLAVLHLPSFVDDLDEPVPGLTPFGYGASLPWNARTRAWGLFADAEPATGFEPIASALLPPPWRDAALTPTRIGELLYAAVPVFRRYVPLEAQNPATAEMDVRGMANAAAITGMLLAPGWSPPAALRARRPRTAAELRDAWWNFP